MRISLLSALAVTALGLCWLPAAMAGVPPHRIVDPDSVMHPSGLPATGALLRVPAPLMASRTTNLSGHLFWPRPGSPQPSAEITYWVPGAAGWLTGTTTTDDQGAFMFGAAPSATANGELSAKIPYTGWSVGRTGLSWPDGGSASFDLVATNTSLSITRGGPWSDWSLADTLLLGNDGVTDVAAMGPVPNPSPAASVDTFVPAMPGSYTAGAVNFWDNEGVEYSGRFRSPLSVDYNSTDAEFVDASHGWVIDREGFVVRTTDGGTSWQYTDTRPGGQGRHLAALDFGDALHGLLLDGAWSSSNAILKTTNGGLSYAVTDVSPEVYCDVAMPDTTHAWVVGEGGVIAKSTDGGSTWKAQTSGTSSTLVSVYFTDTTHGWASGGDGTIVRTTNGGTSWETQTSNVTGWVKCLSIPDGQHGWALNNDGTILSSADAGATWQPAAWQTAEMKPPTLEISWLTLLSATDGWMVGGGSTVLHTTDGGQSWITGHVPSGTLGAWPTMVAGIDSTHAWAAGGQGLLTDTTDGGVTWTDTGASFDETHAQRLTMKTPVFASGKPGSKVTLSFANFPAGWTSSLLGYSAWPVTAPVKSLGTHTGVDPSNERVTVTVPPTATPGYFYVIEAQHQQGPLALSYPFQVCTLKSSAASIRRGASVRLTGTVPTQDHEGSQPGKHKRVFIFKRTTAAGQPTVGDPRTKGWKYVRSYLTDGFGKYRTGLMRQEKATWYVVMYEGDDWYWAGYTSVVRVGVR